MLVPILSMLKNSSMQYIDKLDDETIQNALDEIKKYIDYVEND